MNKNNVMRNLHALWESSAKKSAVQLPDIGDFVFRLASSELPDDRAVESAKQLLEAVESCHLPEWRDDIATVCYSVLFAAEEQVAPSEHLQGMCAIYLMQSNSRMDASTFCHFANYILQSDRNITQTGIKTLSDVRLLFLHSYEADIMRMIVKWCLLEYAARECVPVYSTDRTDTNSFLNSGLKEDIVNHGHDIESIPWRTFCEQCHASYVVLASPEGEV